MAEVEEEMEGKQNQPTEELMELTQAEIEHPGHDHSLILRESLQGDSYGRGCVQVYCDGCREPISSSSPFYACPISDWWFLLHKWCAKLPPTIEHPSHPDHALTLSPFILYDHLCDICYSDINGFRYSCSDCHFDVHVRCASMALHVQFRVDENDKIHKHRLIPLEKEAHFFCDVCGREHKGKSYLCPTCGFWANQICASVPTTVNVDLHSHPHPLALFRSFHCSSTSDLQMCKICDEQVKTARWAYCCSEECKYWVHVGCWLSLEEIENPNKDIQTKFHSKSTSHEIEKLKDIKENTVRITWPVLDESVELMTQLIKNLSLQGVHKRATKILQCKKDHPLIFVNRKIDELKDDQDDQLCDGCAQIITSQFYHCAQCKFSLHEWCAELPDELQHILHPEHPLCLLTQQRHMSYPNVYCTNCYMHTNGFVFCCLICNFYLDLKCASLPRLIKHRGHDHDLVLRRVTNSDSCNSCGSDEFFTFFQCEACNFGLCIKCVLLPFSVKHRYDKHPFTITYSPIKDQPEEYYCEICEEDINSMYWFYHCIECDQSLHSKCIYPIERYWNMKFGVRFEVECHSHLLSIVRCPKVGVLTPCHICGLHVKDLDHAVYVCEQCDFWMHYECSHDVFKKMELTTSMTSPN